MLTTTERGKILHQLSRSNENKRGDRVPNHLEQCFIAAFGPLSPTSCFPGDLRNVNTNFFLFIGFKSPYENVEGSGDWLRTIEAKSLPLG